MSLEEIWRFDYCPPIEDRRRFFRDKSKKLQDLARQQNLREDDELLLSVNSFKYLLVTTFLSFFIGFTCFGSHMDRVEFKPIVDECKKMSKVRKSVWRIYTSKLARAARELFLLFLTLQFLFMLYLTQDHGRLMKKLRPRSSSSLAGCSLRSNIYFESALDLNDYKRWLRLDDQLDQLKVPMMSLPGFGLMALAVISSVFLIYHYLPMLYLRGKRIRMEEILFTFNPFEQRRRVRVELAEMTDNLVRVSMTNRTSTTTTSTNKLLDEIRHQRAQTESLMKRPTFCQRFEQQQQQQTICELRDLKFVEILDQIKTLELVKPENLSAKSHRICVNYKLFYMIASMLSTVAFQLLVVSLSVVTDLRAKAQHRLAIFRCQSVLGDEATLIEDFIRLPKLESSQDRDLYLSNLNNINSFWSTLQLAVWVESKYSFKDVSSIIVLLEMFCILITLGVWSVVYMAFFTSACINKLVWLQQLERQVESCRQLADEQASQVAHLEANSKLCEQLTVTVLNFELFRRHHKEYRKLNTFLVAQIAALTSVELAACYCIAAFMVSSNIGTIIFASAVIVLYMDIYLLCNAYISRKIEIILRKMMTTLAHCTSLEKSAQLESPLDLWRRQLVDQQESRRLFASSLLGFNITYDKLVPINGYLLLLWYFLMRVN